MQNISINFATGNMFINHFLRRKKFMWTLSNTKLTIATKDRIGMGNQNEDFRILNLNFILFSTNRIEQSNQYS